MIDKTQLKTGDIILEHTCGFDFVAMSIRQLTNSYWNHVGLIINENGDWKIIEALPNGIVKDSLDHSMNDRGCEYKVIRIKKEAFDSEENYNKGIEEAIRRANEFVGTKYDFTAITGLMIKYLTIGPFRWLLTKIFRKNILENRYRFFCSELICTCFFNLIGARDAHMFRNNYQSDCSNVTPGDCGHSPNVEFIEGEDKR